MTKKDITNKEAILRDCKKTVDRLRERLKKDAVLKTTKIIVTPIDWRGYPWKWSAIKPSEIESLQIDIRFTLETAFTEEACQFELDACFEFEKMDKFIVTQCVGGSTIMLKIQNQ